MALFIINVYARLNFAPAYWNQLTTVLQFPHSLRAHQDLAQAWWQEGYVPAASRELRFAQSLVDNPRETPDQSILGTTTSPTDLLREWEQEPARLAAQYHYWLSLVKEKPDYRDALVMLGTTAYQLSRFGEAKTYLLQALSLDPNGEVAAKLLRGVEAQP